MLYYHILRFIKNPVKCCAVLLLWMGLICWFLTDSFYSSHFQGAIDLTLPTLPYIFLVFIAVSYECFFDIRRARLEEVVCVGKKNTLGVQLFDFILLMILNGITSVIVYIYHSWFYAQREIQNRSLQLYTCRLVFIYIFLPAFLAILIGWAVSFIHNRLYGLSVLFVVFYIFDSSFVSLLTGLSKSNYLLWKTGTLFSLFFQSGCGNLRDCHYLLTVENIHIYRVLFFCFLVIAGIICAGCQKKIGAILSFLISIGMLVLFFMPSGAVYSLPYMANYFDSVNYDQAYYMQDDQINLDNRKITETRNDFQVTQYKMNFKIKDIMYASVTVVPDRPNLAEYQFTLYHLYHIKEIRNDRGELLPYDQDGDYLLVKNTMKNLTSITIVYSGASQYFYTTSQGMMLPANFEYFPVAGWHNVFFTAGAIFSRELLSQTVQFDVDLQIKGNYPVYSNLLVEDRGKRKGYSCYKIQGNCNGLTLIGNPYLEEKVVDDVRIIYSVLDEENAPTAKNMWQYNEMFNKLEQVGCSMKGKTYIVSPEDNSCNWCVGQDHIVDRPDGFSEILNYYQYGTFYNDYELENEKNSDMF